MYNWQAKGELHRVEAHTVRLGAKIPSPRYVFQGTVAECINKVMAKRPADRVIYSITFGPDFGMDATSINYRQIEDLYNRADFPKAKQTNAA